MHPAFDSIEQISPVYARFVLRETLRQGIPAERLLEGTSLDRTSLESGADIAMEDFLTILKNGRLLSGNEQLGLVIGRHANIIALGSIGAAAAIAPTAREGLKVLVNYTRLHVTYIRLELSSTLHGLSARFHYLQDTGEVERFHTETALMMVQHYLETLTGQVLDDAEYRLAIPAPVYQAEYGKWLHSPVSFDWEYTSAEIPAHWLDLASPYYNATMWHSTTLLLAQRLRELEGQKDLPYSQYVIALLRSCEPPLPDLASVARRVHMSERTLNRRLQQENTSFRTIRGEILGNWARQHLRETDHSVESIATMLGYQDTANFRRAFRACEGCSPSDFRLANGAGRN
jgi:AraC-like DNA-binding protein